MYTLLDDNFFDDMLVSEFEKVCKFISDSKKENKSEHECKFCVNCESKEIIHCKDCEHYVNKTKYCSEFGKCLSPEDYCSSAKKKETIETITKEEYETLLILKTLGAEKLVYTSYAFSGKEFICAHGANFNAEISGNNVKMLKHLFKEQSERKIDDLMKLEVID